MKISGIYEIVNKINGKKYIGSTLDIHRRMIDHKRLLRNQKHSNFHLQNAYNKYGINNFQFNILDITTEENLLISEQKYLDICKLNPKKYYNISYNAEAPTRGMISPMRGKTHTPETIQKIKNNLPKRFGKNHPMFGKKHKMDSIEKMCKSHKEYKPTENTISKIKSTCIKKHLNASNQKFIFYNPLYDKKICRMVDLTYEFNLDGKHVSDICRGVRKTHKGWICIGKV